MGGEVSSGSGGGFRIRPRVLPTGKATPSTVAKRLTHSKPSRIKRQNFQQILRIKNSNCMNIFHSPIIRYQRKNSITQYYSYQ